MSMSNTGINSKTIPSPIISSNETGKDHDQQERMLDEYERKRRSLLAIDLVKYLPWCLITGGALLGVIWYLAPEYIQLAWYSIVLILNAFIVWISGSLFKKEKNQLAGFLFVMSFTLHLCAVPLFLPETLMEMVVGYMLVLLLAGLVVGARNLWLIALFCIPALILDIKLGPHFQSQYIKPIPPNIGEIVSIVMLGFQMGLDAYVLFLVLRSQERLYRQARKANLLLNNEFERAENLLHTILPVKIANRLKSGEYSIADEYHNTSILFADIEGFTSLSLKLPPKDLVDLLNSVFSYFDTLTEKYALEKIKTIGDCYMVASGVPVERKDHAIAITNMALDIQKYMDNNNFKGHKISFRIGINSGPIVAGVIGNVKFAYDMWGDTVNLASRMESHGKSGVIQITRPTYELIKDNFICESMGFINVKGKGELEIWHVTNTL